MQAGTESHQLNPIPPPKNTPLTRSFPKEEEKILDLWDRLDAFKEQLRRSEGKPEYIFFDGPPFATGLPHYGHILAGTLKV
jgi:isoleucyl-tRNA synthetase